MNQIITWIWRRSKLADALQKFAGGVLVISHDQYFIKAVCNEIWLVDDRQVKDYRDGFDAYKKFAISQNKKKAMAATGKK